MSLEQNQMERWIRIDKNGKIWVDGLEFTDSDNLRAQSIFGNLKISDSGSFVTELDGIYFLIEAYDEPLIAKKIHKSEGFNSDLVIELNYGVRFFFDIKSLRLDQWDRFHGYTHNPHSMPFVMSQNAQNDFFNILDSFEDDSVTYQGQNFEIPQLWAADAQVDMAKYWSHIYLTEKPRWDLGVPAPAAVDLINKLKLTPSRIIVLGGGCGHDAAYLASLGHHVTMVDISEEAIDAAKKRYGSIKNLAFYKEDIFNLPKKWRRTFDIVFEHTCYCAINPVRRDELIKVWKSLLTERGNLLGVFFAMERYAGPPFGGTEWELFERLKKHFRTLHWNRFRKSIDRRNGKEFAIYMEVLNQEH